MIKANDLRIGNKILLEGRVAEVFDICYLVDGDEDKEGYLVNSVWIEAFEPIPLTPEILQKAGFEKQKDFYSIQVGNSIYLDYYESVGVSLTPETWKDAEVWIWQEIKYVHQLQNLFFALTGEELQINL